MYKAERLREITKKQAEADGLGSEFYDAYKGMIKSALKLIK